MDLIRGAEELGYQTAVLRRVRYSYLPKLKGPVIIHVQRDEYKHFAVLKGVHGDRVFLADPSLGNVSMPIERFDQEWTGVALIIRKKGFGLPTKYPLALEDEGPLNSEMTAARRALYVLP